MNVNMGTWGKEEDKYLIDNLGRNSNLKIARKLNRSLNAVNGRIRTLRKNGEIEPTHYKGWTKEDEDFLVKNHTELTLKKLAKVLDRTESSIKVRRSILGLGLREIIDAENNANDDIAYQKLINEPVKAGLKKSDIKVKLGQVYKMERVGVIFKEQWKFFIGKVIHETKDHFTLKNKIRAETFLKVDILINEFKMKEVS